MDRFQDGHGRLTRWRITRLNTAEPVKYLRPAGAAINPHHPQRRSPSRDHRCLAVHQPEATACLLLIQP
jgi:hypothetical protein